MKPPFSADLLDRWIRHAVCVLHEAGVDTYESCQGGRGHAFPEPTIRFNGSRADAKRAVRVALGAGLPAYSLRQFWHVSEVAGAASWEMTFYPPSKLRAAALAHERERRRPSTRKRALAAAQNVTTCA